MSYILDALKKAEEERRRGKAPDLATVQDIRVVKERGARSLWVYLMMAALFLNAGVLVWWLGPWSAGRWGGGTVQKAEGKRAITETESVRQVSDPAAPVAALPVKKVEPGATGNSSTVRGAEKVLPSAEANTAGKKSNPSPAVGTGVKGSVVQAPLDVHEIDKESAGSDEAPPPPAGNRMYAMEQLPASVREGLPEIRMSLHYFTNDPSLRLVRINGETLREGREISPGLRLEEITSDGAVFTYRHYRFRLGMQPQ